MNNTLKNYQFDWSLIGTHYLEYLIDHKKINVNITDLYSDCAIHFDVTPSQVERCCRHAIKRTFEQHTELFKQLYPIDITCPPTNKEFIWNSNIDES